MTAVAALVSKRGSHVALYLRALCPRTYKLFNMRIVKLRLRMKRRKFTIQRRFTYRGHDD